MRVEMRYATAADYRALHGEISMPFSRYGFALAINGRTVGLACFRYDKSRHLLACVDLLPEARKHPLSLHRWAKAALAAAKNTGAKSFLVIADKAIPRSEAWVERLGLKAVGDSDAGTIYQWQAS